MSDRLQHCAVKVYCHTDRRVLAYITAFYECAVILPCLKSLLPKTWPKSPALVGLLHYSYVRIPKKKTNWYRPHSAKQHLQENMQVQWPWSQDPFGGDVGNIYCRKKVSCFFALTCLFTLLFCSFHSFPTQYLHILYIIIFLRRLFNSNASQVWWWMPSLTWMLGSRS